MTDDARHLLVPGFSQTPQAWSAVIAGLPGEVEALDIPGSGNFAEAARQLARGRTGIWAGYSMGGRLALRVALDRPEQVRALMLISTSPGIADDAERARRRRADDDLANWAEQHGREAFLDRWTSQPLFSGLDPAATRRHRLESIAEIAGQLRRLGQGVQQPMWDRLGELTMPVVLIAGERDHRYSAIARRMAATIGNRAQLCIVPNAGHALLEEQPGAIAELLRM